MSFFSCNAPADSECKQELNLTVHNKTPDGSMADIVCQADSSESDAHSILDVKTFDCTSYTSAFMPCSHQWFQFRVINEVELRDEVVVVLVAGIDVGLCTHVADAVKVMNVNMHEHPEETTQDLLAHLLEVLGEGNT